jgi:hypothetical protein
MFAGFKIIKPDGEERIISLEDHMVTETSEYNNYKMETYKLAIPDLEVGDIIDYYMVEERVIGLYGRKIYSFDPVIVELNSSYPILKQRIAFDVLRRCYINMKSLNGAPKFRLSEEAEDENINRYVIEDENRERVDEITWLYTYREVPTLKFKVTYASALAAEYSSFLGTAGSLKSSISEKELADHVKLVFSGVNYPGFKRLMKKHYSHLTDDLDVAKAAYYLLRYMIYVKGKEKLFLDGEYDRVGLNFVRQLSNYYKFRGINHRVIIGIPRVISSIDDLILENELNYILELNLKGEKYYISNFDAHSYFGELDPNMQGTKVFATISTQVPVFHKENLPVIASEKNRVEAVYSYTVADLENGKLNFSGKNRIWGAGRQHYQEYLLDFYSFLDEEDKRHPYQEEFEGIYKRDVPKYEQKKQEILESRDKDKKELIKTMLENDLPEVEINEVLNYSLINTGRFDDQGELSFEFSADISGPLKKAGPNYLINIGELIDAQIEIPEDQKIRKYNIYMDYAASYTYTLEFVIPEGYEIQGLEKLEIDQSNMTGAFYSTSRVEEGKLVLEVKQSFASNYQPVENWTFLLELVEAANTLENAQVLMKKLNKD